MMKIKSFIQKVICIVVVFVMLAGNFISPVISIAEELSENEKANVTETNVEVNNNEGGEEPVAGESEDSNDGDSEDKTQAKIDEIEAAFDAGQEKQNENEQEPEPGQSEDNVENTNEGEENQEQQEQEDEIQEQLENNNEDDNQIDEQEQNQEQDQSQPSNAKGAKKSAPALRGANNQSSETQSDKIEDRITPDKIDEIEEKAKNDAYEINTFQTEFVSGATKDENGNLVWTADTNASGHEFRFRINYALSGLKAHPAEAIKITIPKQILRNRAGNLADKYEMSLPTDKEYDGTTEFTYIENEDYIVIYNPDPVEAAVNGYVEVAYKTNQSTTNYRDYDKTKTDLITNGGTASDPFNAVITVKTTVNNHEDTLAKKSDNKNVFVDTTVKIQSTQKYQPTIYRDWNNSWMEEVPVDKDDYYYLVWKVVTFIQDGTQPYTFSLQDTVTNLTAVTSADDYQFVGYKLSGEIYYSDKNIDMSPRIGSPRTDYVLTRHKKSTFSNINYQLKNTVKATVYPVDEVDPSTNAISSNIFRWNSAFTIPTGHLDLYKYGNSNWGNGYWDYANYDLDKLQNGEVDELKGFKYSTSMVGYAYPWTLKDGGSSNNPEDYGYNPVNYDTWDDTLYLENDENPMNYEDYYLEYFTYAINNSDAEYNDFYNIFDTKSAIYANDEILKFYGKFADSQDWIEIGTVNLGTREIVFDDIYVDEMTTSKVTFKPGIHATGWRYTTTNKHYYTGISVVPYYVLTNSDYVMEKIANKDRIEIKNIVKTHITNYKNETIFDAERAAIDYARVTYYDSYIKKKVTAGSNNVVKRKYNISWKVNAYETATNGNGDTEYIRQDSGRFYDLIPAGGEIDVKSIQVQAEKEYLPENEYSYEIIPDYKNSGRTLLIINIDIQAQYYTVYYKTVHSWESIHDFGREVLNPVAYETGNDKIAKGFQDDGGDLSEENKALFTDLDNTTDANKFLYDEQPYSINALTATISGLFKKVKSENDTDYKYDTKVESNGRYSYQLRYQNTFLNKTKDLILYDSLENFKIVDSEAGTVRTSGWKGTIQSIDLNQIRRMGIEPVVYISTQEDLNLEEHKDLTDSSIWTKATATTNLFEAKAIAIDLRKDTYGNDFVLEPGESISAILNMKAPEQINEEAERNPYAYNNIYLSGILLDGQEEISNFFVHQDYTSIKYYIMADVPVVKVNEEDKSEKIKGITFRLYGTSNYGTDIDKYVTSDKNGKIVFDNIELGEYKLQEYETNDDWLIDYTEHTVVIDRSRDVYIDGEIVNELIPFEITNKPRVHTDVEFIKRDCATKAFIKGAKFKLSGISDYGNEILCYVYSDDYGKVEFKDLEKGIYELIEIETIEGYVPDDTKYKVIIDENGNYDIQKQIINKIRTDEIIGEKTVIKYSHTPNINDEGYASSYYRSYQEITDVVTIPKAEELEVTVYYGIRTSSTDWMAVYSADIVPSIVNYNSSISGKLNGGTTSYITVNSNGYQNACNVYTTTISGDTVKFFNTRYTSSNYYGYYAIITAKVPDTVEVQYSQETYESIYDNGNYYIYNEPYHYFYFTKKDAYNYEKLGGAEFKLYGFSNKGNLYNKTVASAPGTGYVTFDNLESGSYLLKEVKLPNTDNISYVSTEEEHIVEVYEDGKVIFDGKTIWPLSENKNIPFDYYNIRNKGQITVTKKWNDGKTNDDREEPTIYISTKKPVQSYTRAYFQIGKLITNKSESGATPKAFKRNTVLSEDEVIQKFGVKRFDNDASNENTEYKIYGWVENDGTFYWWTKADYAVLPNNLGNYFDGQDTLETIDWDGIYKWGYWKGEVGDEELTDGISNMSRMFYNCKKLDNLDISWFNNIDSNVSMTYVFGKPISTTYTENSTTTDTQSGELSSLKHITIGDNFEITGKDSVLKFGIWKNLDTGLEYEAYDLVGKIEPGTYEYTQERLVSYAVQIYGIQQDVDANGNVLGLSFGPAMGNMTTNSSDALTRINNGNYKNSYRTHDYVEQANGLYRLRAIRVFISDYGSESTISYLTNIERTREEVEKYSINLHEMSWEEIAEQSRRDPTVFRDCMLCGDTKSVNIRFEPEVVYSWLRYECIHIW